VNEQGTTTRECKAKSVDRLVRLPGVDVNSWALRLGFGKRKRFGLLLKQGPLIRICEPALYRPGLALANGWQAEERAQANKNQAKPNKVNAFERVCRHEVAAEYGACRFLPAKESSLAATSIEYATHQRSQKVSSFFKGHTYQESKGHRLSSDLPGIKSYCDCC
jgi:hypothetical protein